MRSYIFVLNTVLGTLVLSGVTTGLHAQHDDRLEEIVVTARPDSAQGIDHIAQPVSVLQGDRLFEKMAGTLGETLAREPGVSASDFGQGASRPVIRGMAGPRVRILQNGLGSMDVSTISVDHAVTLEPMSAEQIEVLRGPATLLFGSGASGGIVNISNNRIHEKATEPFSASISGGFLSAAEPGYAGFNADAQRGGLGLHIDGMFREAGDYSGPSGAVQNSGVRSRDLNGGLSWIVEEKGFFGFSFGHFENRYEIPVDPLAPEEVYIDQAQDRIDISGRILTPLPGVRGIRLRVGHVDYGHTEFEGPGEPGTVFSNDEWELRAEIQHEPLAGWDGTGGFQYRKRDFSALGDEAFVPPAGLESAGIFMLENTDRGDWHFEGGLRYERQTVTPVSLSGLPEISHTAWSVSAGTVWHFDDLRSVGLSLTRSQRAPDIEELLSNGPHLSSGTYEIGDTTLEVETANNLDLSLRREHDATQWMLNLFFNYIEDYVHQREQDGDGDGSADRESEDGNPGGDLLLVRQMQGDAFFYGLEAEFTRTLIEREEWALDLRLWGDWVRARLQQGGDLPRIPPGRLGMELEYNRGPWHADLDLVNTFAQDQTAGLETVTPAYLLLDTGISYEWQSSAWKTTLALRGSNLLNEDARRHTSFLKDRAPLPGRAVTARLRLEY